MATLGRGCHTPRLEVHQVRLEVRLVRLEVRLVRLEVHLVRLEVRLVRLVEGMADITMLAHPPEASPPVVAEVECPEEWGAHTKRATANIPPLVRGIILFNIGSKWCVCSPQLSCEC
jgi:hypothetical protein